MAQTFYDQDADPQIISAKKVAVIGYGSQGHAHALNLRDSGVEVRVGLADGSRSREKARQNGITVGSVSEVSNWAQVIMLLAPDTAQPQIYRREIEPFMREGKTLMFGHGFNIRFGTIQPSAEIDVSMVAPKAPGHRVRETYQSGEGTPALVAVEQDGSGQALALALSYARALGCTRAGVIATTFAEEAETDLFGEQAVLCGGVSELVKAGFDTLVEAGYQPEVAYFECLHELKLIVDLFYQGGLNYMRYSVSDTAEYGGYTAGKRIISPAVRQEMGRLLAAVQDGSFARQWIDECGQGCPNFKARRAQERQHPIEKVGAELRQRMPFLKQFTIEEHQEAPAKTLPASPESPSEPVTFF